MNDKKYDKVLQSECEKARVVWFAFIVVLVMSVLFLAAIILDVAKICVD